MFEFARAALDSLLCHPIGPPVLKALPLVLLGSWVW